MRRILSVLAALVFALSPSVALASASGNGVLTASSDAYATVPMINGTCNYLIQNNTAADDIWVGFRPSVTNSTGTKVVPGWSASIPGVTYPATTIYVYTTAGYTGTVSWLAVCS